MTAELDRTLRILVVGDTVDDDQGFVGERLAQHGGVSEPLDRDLLPDYDVVAGDTPVDLVLLLGSARSGAAPGQAGVVEREAAFVLDALDNGVPVLGICYGSQLIAHALGGAIMESPRPEIDVLEVPTNDSVLCPPGPWVMMHSDTFAPPATATAFGATRGGCVGFADESYGARVLAWQFHPEAKPEVVAGWLDRLADWVAAHGGDAEDVRERVFALEDDLRRRSYDLTDSAVEWLLDRAEARVAG